MLKAVSKITTNTAAFKNKNISRPKFNKIGSDSFTTSKKSNLSFKGGHEDFDKIAEKAKVLVKSEDGETKQAGLLLIEHLPMYKAKEFLNNEDEDVIIASIKAIGQEKYNKEEALEHLKPFLEKNERYENSMGIAGITLVALAKLTFDKANKIFAFFSNDPDKYQQELKHVIFTTKTQVPDIKTLITSRDENKKRMGAILLSREINEANQDIKLFTPLLKDPSPKVVMAAIEGLGLCNKDLKPLCLIKRFVFHKNEAIAITAAKTLGELGESEYLIKNLEKRPIVMAEGLKKYLEIHAQIPECA